MASKYRLNTDMRKTMPAVIAAAMTLAALTFVPSWRTFGRHEATEITNRECPHYAIFLITE